MSIDEHQDGNFFPISEFVLETINPDSKSNYWENNFLSHSTITMDISIQGPTQVKALYITEMSSSKILWNSMITAN